MARCVADFNVIPDWVMKLSVKSGLLALGFEAKTKWSTCDVMSVNGVSYEDYKKAISDVIAEVNPEGTITAEKKNRASEAKNNFVNNLCHYCLRPVQTHVEKK